MNTDDAAEYAYWLALANDPNQSEADRRDYRELMAAHLHRKVREAFQFAAEQMPRPPAADSGE